MKAVYDFNQKRNEFKLNEELERDMLVEEIKEFYDATKLAERIDAMIDVNFVYDGTIMKYNYNGMVVPEETTKIYAQFRQIAKEVVIEELGDDAQYFDKIMQSAWQIVCDINSQKTTNLRENGKVDKQADLPNATERIQEMLDSLLTEEKAE